MWDKVGLVRDEPGLSDAREELAGWESAPVESRSHADHELRNMILIGRLMATAALERQESRGSHSRRDFPNDTARWQRHIVLYKAAAFRSAKEVR